jgi:5-methylcytosine-specific restriction endonuclease McrA
LKTRLPSEEYSVLTQLVFTRDGWKCRNCGYRQDLHAHHIKFRSNQGADTMSNLCTLCSRCHDEIHNNRLEILGDDANYELNFRRVGTHKEV